MGKYREHGNGCYSGGCGTLFKREEIMNDPQWRRILRDLEAGESLTVAEALSRHKCYALSQRIGEIRRKGYPIKREMVTVPSGARVCRYSMEVKL